MKLEKQIEVEVCEVIADYQKQTRNPVYISILNFTIEKAGAILASELHKELLFPMSEKACENLLDKLTNMGYFNHDNEDNSNYVLTDKGYNSAENNVFYEPKNALLKLYIGKESKLLTQIIIKLEEFESDTDKESDIEDKDLSEYPIDEIIELNKTVRLKNAEYILNELATKFKVLNDEKMMLTLNSDAKKTLVSCMDYEVVLNENSNDIKDILLKNKYGNLYNTSTKILKVDFNKDDLQLSKTVSIKEPYLAGEYFNSISLKNIQISPKTKQDACIWFKELLKSRINQYYFSEEEFKEFANSVANEFIEYSNILKNTISITKMKNLLNREIDFYKKSKLETIEYLNY